MFGWFLIGWFSRGLFSPPQDTELALIAQARQVIGTQYYGGAPEARSLTYSAIRGMVQGLGDNYAQFWEARVAARNAAALEAPDGVIGLRGEMQNGAYVVTSLSPDQPAARAGLQIGDVVLEADAWPVRRDASAMEVTSMVRGEVGSIGHLVVRRGDQNLNFDVPRVQAPDVVTRTIGSDIGYLRFDRFTAQTPASVLAALRQLMALHPSGLILDLRNNGGGSMDATQQVLDYFEDEGIAFYGRTRDGNLTPFPTRSGDLAEDIPLAVLIGRNTYSAPETAAASILDRHRGTLIGETTHGKGMLNTTVRLMDGSAIQLSVAQSLSPVTQTWYEGRGVSPQIIVRQDPSSQEDTVLQYAVQYLNGR
jgi:carboxyl-terminal processing protease